MQRRLLYKFVDWQEKCEDDDESYRREPAHVGFTMTGKWECRFRAAVTSGS